MKASFALSMRTHKKYFSALFNTPLFTSSVEVDTNGETWLVEQFEPTERMSTYLVAFVVSDFIGVSKKSEKNVDVQVYARPEAIQDKEAEFALNHTAQVIDFFSNYYEIDYPLRKTSLPLFV
jgi:aminopeptidase N